ncbi:MAG: methyltransferase domain-containing protein [bacterium]|nr:methyltransferase domain-containing protein [bacterium]
MVGRYETQEYAIPVAGGTLRLLGPSRPHALHYDVQGEGRLRDDDYAPYWATPSEAGLMLAGHLHYLVPPGPEPLLELGAGLGLVGLALARAGHRMVMTDGDQDALAFVRANARLNGVQLQAVQVLDWRHPPAERFATIVAGDVLYEKRHHQPIAALIAECLKPGGTAWLSDLNRRSAEAFPDVLRTHRLDFEALPVTGEAIPRPGVVDGQRFNGTIYRVGQEAA